MKVNENAMKNLKVLILISMALLALTSLASADETLYNGIALPDQWPPDYGELTRAPMPVPYLKNPPAVIFIDVGRQPRTQSDKVLYELPGSAGSKNNSRIRTMPIPSWQN